MPLNDSQILAMPITHLVAAQIHGETTALEIVQCYLRRAAVIHTATNCFICWVPDVLDEARRCDQYLSEHGKPIGSLHGVPCTIKDHYAMKGLPVTMGLKTLKDRMEQSGGARHDAVAVLALRAAGAIPIAKTNMTQQGETWGGGNPAYGDTLNPWNTLRTTGGSSSGEGGAVSGSASVFGIGSDVGGSVRCPASFCGVAGFKPTAQRFSFAWDDGRTILNHPGDYGILATGGPLARHVSDLVEVLKACWSETSPMLKIDTRTPFMPFRNDVLASSRPLTIGYYVKGGYTHPAPCPTTVRCMDRIVEALQAAGHKLVPFDPSDTVAWEDLHPVLLAQLGVGERAEEPSGEEQKERTGNYSSTSDDASVDTIHPDLASMPLAAQGPGRLMAVPTSMQEYHEVLALRDRQRDQLNKAWNQAGLDVLLCPAWAFPAPPVEEVRNLAPAVWTTQAWNYFDMPAGVVPSGLVTADDLDADWAIELDQGSDTTCKLDEKFGAACVRSRVDALGMPVSAQLIGQPWREELVLRAMLEVERAVAGSIDNLESNRSQLDPVPRRSPEMGAKPELL